MKEQNADAGKNLRKSSKENSGKKPEKIIGRKEIRSRKKKNIPVLNLVKMAAAVGVPICLFLIVGSLIVGGKILFPEKMEIQDVNQSYLSGQESRKIVSIEQEGKESQQIKPVAQEEKQQNDPIGQDEIPDWIDVDLIPVDGTSRRGIALEGVEDIVIHYVGNPGTSAAANRNWYTSSQSEVSSHFLVGLEGEIIQCVPLDEKSSATNWRNKDTISIEVCHPDESGKFNDDTYQSLVRLTAWLCEQYGLDGEHIIRHYDVTGKECPRYFVIHEDAWEQFKEDVKELLSQNSILSK